MIESEMARGVWIDRSEAEPTTLRELLDRYEREVVPGKRGAVQEGSVLATWRDVLLAVRTVATIRGADEAVLRDEWLKDYAPVTVLRRLAVLSHVFNVARKEWGMESLANPVELVRKPSPSNARTRRIAAASPSNGRSRGRTQDELALVVETSESPMLPALVTLAVETTMRRGEIAALRWEHVDLERRVAHLPETKNGNSRDVPLSPVAAAALATLLPKPPGKCRKMPIVPTGLRGRVFAMRPDGIAQAFGRAQHRARAAYEAKCTHESVPINPNFLNDLHFHDLRHEATSTLAEKFQLHELAKVTGHCDTQHAVGLLPSDASDLAKRLR